MDERTRLEKLQAMAAQTQSPEEAAIAAAKLAEMGSGFRSPPHRPTRVGAGSFEDWPSSSNSVGSAPFSFTFTIRFG